MRKKEDVRRKKRNERKSRSRSKGYELGGLGSAKERLYINTCMDTLL